MSAGYGRGYYGEEQLAPQPPQRRGGWVKVALVVGVGAIVWFMWPRRPKLPTFGVGEVPQIPPPQPMPALPAPAVHTAEQLQLAGVVTLPSPSPSPSPPSSIAESRGYPSQQAYEDAVVATARELQQTGAKIVLAPHLQHLTPRLGP